ncbi:uncharacterized protein LOC116257719 isoform X2 [Nymphaea colorata]|uniref:uncharacterized protein LOC116257719 isoform X2 n=1 Tax=Nymphaea colorata TaxID=210225 RepID=UPI00129EB34F|nr:uncharacterized protein LOC116257719 isoform X2 [Nymphaea colorata]
MKARLVVFPIRGRNWCFARAVQQTPSGPGSANESLTLRDLWRQISSSRGGVVGRTELVTDFVAHKMDRAWSNLAKAPAGSMKSKIYGFGQRLLARVQPSELFLKSISKEITGLQIIFPRSLNPRLVRRRLRHAAITGNVYHRRFFYGSVSMLPFTAIFTGSARLLLLVSDCSASWTSVATKRLRHETETASSHYPLQPPSCPWVLEPSGELEKVLVSGDSNSYVSNCTISAICKAFELDEMQVLKFRDSKSV